MKYYQERIVAFIDWFDWTLSYYDIGVNLKDFGFEAFAPESTESAREAIIEGIIENGVYDSTNNWYTIRENYNYTGYSIIYSLTYHVNSGNVSATMGVFLDDGFYWNVYVSLIPHSKGMYYSCTLNQEIETGYEKLNNIIAYLDPITFTEDTLLTYEKCDNDPTTLLPSYSMLISKLLYWIDSAIERYNIGIALNDLGF